jgi:hypothetical protein
LKSILGSPADDESIDSRARCGPVSAVLRGPGETCNCDRHAEYPETSANHIEKLSADYQLPLRIGPCWTALTKQY